MAKLGEISVAIVADTKKFNDGINRSRKGLDNLAGSASKSLSKLTKLFAAATAGAGALGALGWGIKLASEAETANVAFRTLLGSQEKATKLIGEIKTLAASTPLGTAELLDASRKLASFGEDANTIPDTLRRIGDVSAAIGAPIGEIAELYGKARVQGRLFGEDINQLTGRGIPIIGELAKQFGVAESEVKKLVETGQVNFGNLEKAFVSMTSKGGMFAGMLSEQSKTLAGQWSTLKDNITAIALELGNTLLPVIKRLVELTTKFVSKWNEVKQAGQDVLASGPGVIGQGIAFAGDFIPGMGGGHVQRELLKMEAEKAKRRREKIASLDASRAEVFERRAATAVKAKPLIGDDFLPGIGKALKGSAKGFFRNREQGRDGNPIGDFARRVARLPNDTFNPVTMLAKARKDVAKFVADNPNVLLGSMPGTEGATNSAVLKGSEQAQRLINQQRVRMLGGGKDKVQKDQLAVLKELLAAAKQQIDGGQVVNIQ